MYKIALRTRLVALYDSTLINYFFECVYTPKLPSSKLTILWHTEEGTAGTDELASRETAQRKDQEDENFEH